MANVDESLEEKGYVRWVQTGTCLAFVKKGLEGFASEQSKVLQQRIKYLARDTPSFNAMCFNVEIEKKIGDRWKMKCNLDPKLQCKGCQIYLDELQNVCVKPFSFTLKHFGISNIHAWPVDNMHWNMAKLYMNPGHEDETTCQTPEATDLSNILNFIEHCSISNLAIHTIQSLKEVRKCRNLIMHSSTFTVDQQDFENFTKYMINLLEDQTALSYRNEAKEEVLKIKEVQKSDFVITTDAEFKVLRDRAIELQKQNDTMKNAVEDLQKECEDLEGKDDEKSKTDLAELIKQIEENETSLKEMESTFYKLESFASKKKDLSEKMKRYIAASRTLLFETKERLSDLKKKYNRDLTLSEENALAENLNQYETDEERYNAMKEMSETLTIQNTQLKEQIDSMTLEMQTVKVHKNKNEELIQELQQENKNIQEELKNSKATCEKLYEEVKDKTHKILELTEELNKNTSDNKILQNNLESLKAELESVTTRKTALENLNAELQNEVTKLEEQNSSLEKHIESLMTSNNEYETRIQELDLENKNKQQALKDIKAICEQLSEDVEGKQNEIAELKQELDRRTSDNYILQANLDSLNAELELITARKTELEKLNVEIHNEVTKLKDEILEKENRYENRIVELHQINENTQKELEDVKATKDKMRQELEDKDNEITKLKADLIRAVQNLEKEREKRMSEIRFLREELLFKDDLINRFKTDLVSVSELKKVNNRLKRTDSTLFRVWCFSIILYVIIFVVIYRDHLLSYDGYSLF